MNLRQKNKAGAEIFTSAMNDIMFFLMLFFIIVSTLLNPNVIKLSLPSAKNTQSLHKKEILLSVNKDLQYFVNNQQVPFEQLQSVLSVEASKDKEAFVVLRCDKTLAIQQLVNVLEIGNKLNVKMILATQKQ
ncbi:MAG: biopolymer transporter ExbD [Paludibacter sp.]|jgi:biopolymer transport protein ExbD|nr:biopolymer transporter ExbD [Paludibacter sp.]MBV5282723.1 biopolymer transporter ExbD [Paludibacter sp.]